MSKIFLSQERFELKPRCLQCVEMQISPEHPKETLSYKYDSSSQKNVRKVAQ